MEIITREEWGAAPPRGGFAAIETPTPDLWLHHTTGSYTGAEGMRRMQREHQEDNGWKDIAYSYVLDPADLRIYEGRGNGIEGAHTQGHNKTSHGIAVMGDYTDSLADADVAMRLAELVNHGRSNDWWMAGFTGGHSEVVATECPGLLLKAIPTINQMSTQLSEPWETTLGTAPLEVLAISNAYLALKGHNWMLLAASAESDSARDIALAADHFLQAMKAAGE